MAFPRLRSQRRLGRFGNRLPGTTTRAARSSLHALRRKCRGRKHGTESSNRQVERRKARVPASWGRKGPRQPLACRVMARRGCASCTRAPYGAPPPLDRGGTGISRPGRNASRERRHARGLFDIVEKGSDFGRTNPTDKRVGATACSAGTCEPGTEAVIGALQIVARMELLRNAGRPPRIARSREKTRDHSMRATGWRPGSGPQAGLVAGR